MLCFASIKRIAICFPMLNQDWKGINPFIKSSSIAQGYEGFTDGFAVSKSCKHLHLLLMCVCVNTI